MTAFALFALAALCEIAGCFAFWAWMRLGHSSLWLLPGVGLLIGFAWMLTQSPADQAGRSFASYGGIYIAASLVWMWLVEGRRPDIWDLAGAGLCLMGAAVILLAPRGA